jgi:hypothetical protein
MTVKHLPELQDLEHAILQTLVRVYGAAGIAALAHAMEADLEAEDAEGQDRESYSDDQDRDCYSAD